MGLERQRCGDSQGELGWNMGLLTHTEHNTLSYSLSEIYDLLSGG